MIGIIVAGHGNFATGITSTVNLVAGEQDDYMAVDFIEGMSGEELVEKIDHAIKTLKTNDILIFTDILGGAPFRSASTLAQSAPHITDANIEVISGTNAQMILEACLEREEYDDVASLANDIIVSGREGISSLKLELKEKAAQKAAQNTEDGGI
ncbi:MAG: PTS galactosamine/N-acetylgalactosamine transporter subunit IIA [Alphaproteobacteria bacterium]